MIIIELVNLFYGKKQLIYFSVLKVKIKKWNSMLALLIVLVSVTQ